MSTNTPDENEPVELNDRTERALTQYLTVLNDVGRVKDAEDLYLVVSESGKEYLVDRRTASCECPDHEHRNARCKHLRRVAFATGSEPVPSDVEDVDPQLGEHVDGGPEVVATDGSGVLDEEPADPWKGPHAEYDQYGQPTGGSYVRCRDLWRRSRHLGRHGDGLPP